MTNSEDAHGCAQPLEALAQIMNIYVRNQTIIRKNKDDVFQNRTPMKFTRAYINTFRLSTFLMASLFSIQNASANTVLCFDLFSPKKVPSAVSGVVTHRKLPEAWAESISALKQINRDVFGREQVIESLTTAILAREFVWINGEPGGAKTYLSRLMFQSVLNSIPEKDKKVFVLQFHKLVSEGKISGFQKFSSMMKDGKYEIETESSLVGDKFLFLIADEAEKSNPAVLNTLLSVLNERKAFLGARVVDAALSSGVFTSNKTTGEFIQSFLNDRPSGEALLDRMAIKIHIPNQQLSAKETVAMYDLVKNPSKARITLPLRELESLVAKVKIPDEMMTEIVSIAREFDRYITRKSDQSRAEVRYDQAETEYFPANQFSNRSVRRLVTIFKASFIARQLAEGIPFQQISLQPSRKDLGLLSRSALYTGPAGLRLKTFELTDLDNGVPVTSPFGSEVKLKATYSPYTGELFLQDGMGRTQLTFALKDQTWILKSKSADYADWSVDSEAIAELSRKIESTAATHAIDLAKPQFEVDQGIDQLLAKGTHKERTRTELESIKKDLEQFANILNQHLDRDQAPLPPTAGKLLPARSEKEKRKFRREMLAAPIEQRISRSYEWMSYEVRALKQRFLELDYSIEAHLTGILSDNHLYVFGPPGGAKTALAEVILKAELRKLNADQVDRFVQSTLHSQQIGHDPHFLRAVLNRIRKEKPQVFDRFLLQFHKLLPEGVLIGFPKIEKQLNEGKEEIEVSTSLANQRFVFAILDEVDKANPQTVTTLLSILNEREVFAGNQVIKTALRSAILTSNKMPSEFLDSYNEDRSTGEAIMDRAINKVYVSNKISSEEELTRFLMHLEKGISPNWQGLLALGELRPLVNQVEFENPAVREMLAEIHTKFLALRIQKEEDSRRAHRMDPREFPDYYVSAAGSASDRTLIKLFDQFKARFIAHQLMQGVPFKDLRTTIELKDLGLFFEGLGYWAPQKIEFFYNQEGILTFKNDSQVIERLIRSGVVDSRVRFQLEMMLDEAQDYVRVLNSTVSEFIQNYRREITNYPDLFPSLFDVQPTHDHGLSSPKTPLRPDEAHNSIETAIRSLSHLRLNLDQAKARASSDSIDRTALDSEYRRKEKALIEYLEKHKIMTRTQLFERMKGEIAQLQGKERAANHLHETNRGEEARRRKEQEELLKFYVIDGTRAVMHRVEPGTFKMGEIGKQVEVTITKPFEMMATPTTQLIWRKVAELAAQKLPGKYQINENPSRVNGDTRPVVHVSYLRTQEWITALNELSAAGEPALADLISGHQKGDVYRLPTEAEWEFVARGRGELNDTYHFGNQEAEIGDYAWYRENSGDESHPVAQKKPLVIDGLKFYDMLGNVYEWVQDWHQADLPGGTDPQGPGRGEVRVIRGGGFRNSAADLSSAQRQNWRQGDGFHTIGFRLVRTAR